MQNKMFVFEQKKAPIWFEELCLKGKAKINRDEDGNILSATLFSPSGSKIAKIGDTIVYSNSGLAVIPNDKAKKYGVQKSDKVVKKEKTDN